jgi:YD repeat-containing protein
MEYAPNALGQATRAGDFASQATYFPNGALKRFVYGNGIVHTMQQNARQLPARVTSSGGVNDTTYNYDANGNVTNIWDLARGDHYSRWLSYDNLDRLTAAGSGSFGGDAWHRMSYDALDNLTSWKLHGVKDYAQYVYGC